MRGLINGLKYKVFLADVNPGLEAHWPRLFDRVTVDEDKLAKLLARPEPVRRYVIFFTPRSGSSRLTDLLTRTGVLVVPAKRSIRPSCRTWRMRFRPATSRPM